MLALSVAINANVTVDSKCGCILHAGYIAVFAAHCSIPHGRKSAFIKVVGICQF